MSGFRNSCIFFLFFQFQMEKEKSKRNIVNSVKTIIWRIILVSCLLEFLSCQFESFTEILKMLPTNCKVAIKPTFILISSSWTSCLPSCLYVPCCIKQKTQTLFLQTARFQKSGNQNRKHKGIERDEKYTMLTFVFEVPSLGNSLSESGTEEI